MSAAPRSVFIMSQDRSEAGLLVSSCFKDRERSTVVAGTGFRSKAAIEALVTCDRLTIAPKFLEQLSSDNGALANSIDDFSAGSKVKGEFDNEPEFQYALNSDAMATEKLAEGIRGFVADLVLLEALLFERLSGSS